MMIYPNNYWQRCFTCGGNGINGGATCWSCGGAGGYWHNPQPWVQPWRPPYKPWPPRPPFNPPGGGWVPQCTCGKYTGICPVHPGGPDRGSSIS